MDEPEIKGKRIQMADGRFRPTIREICESVGDYEGAPPPMQFDDDDNVIPISTYNDFEKCPECGRPKATKMSMFGRSAWCDKTGDRGCQIAAMAAGRIKPPTKIEKI